MTQTTKIEMTANDQGVLSALEKQGRAMDKLADKLGRIEKAGEKGSRTVQTGFSKAGKEIASAASQLIGFGSAVGGIGALVGIITKEMAELRRRDQEARTAQMTAGEAVRSARINFVPDASLQNKDLEAELQKVAEKTRTPVGTVAAAFSSAASAKGSLTNKEAMRAVEAAFTLQPGNLATGVELGSRSLDIAKLQKGLDPRAAVGFMLNLQSASRVTELPRLGANAPSAIAASAALGDTPEQGGELFATLTSLLSDAQGSVSATAQKTLVSRLASFVPELAGKDARGKFKVPAGQVDAFNAVANPTARMEVLQQNPELRRDFLARNPFGAEVQTGIERLLSGEKGAMAEFQQARRTINPLNAAQEGAFDQKVRELEGGQFQGAVTAAQGTAAATERAQLRNAIGARRAAARGALVAGLDNAAIPNVERAILAGKFDYLNGDANSRPEQAAIDILKSQTGDIKRRMDPSQRIFGNAGDIPIITEDQVAIAKQQLQALQDQITVLETLRDDSRRRDPPAQRREPAQQALGRR